MKLESNKYFSLVIVELMKPNLIKMKNKFLFKMEWKSYKLKDII